VSMDEIKKLLGKFPEKVQLNSRVVEEVDCGSYIRRKVVYSVEETEQVSAYVCIPKNLTGKVPAIYCHHQHNGEFELGKSEVVGMSGNPDQAYAKELVERGYITFSPDSIAFEERQGGGQWFELATRLMQGKTLMAKVLHDVSVGLDYLASMPEVDLDNIGFIGHSYGGRMALWVPAFDDRVKVSVSNCGCIDYRNSLTRDTGIQMEFCIPGFMERFDLEDVIALSSCPLLISAAEDDKWSRGYENLHQLIKARGRTDVELKVYSGGHEFNTQMREYAYQFIDQNIGNNNSRG
jgi:dienelactone hydrolase